MISVEIEKEINQENEVVAGLNLRQTICVIILAVISVILCFVFSFDTNILFYPITGVAVVLYAFGWYKPNGIPFEKYALKVIQSVLYGSNTRRYKTKNQYVTMVNEEYARRKNIDMADPKLKKQIAKEQKKMEKEMKKASSHSVCKPVA